MYLIHIHSQANNLFYDWIKSNSNLTKPNLFVLLTHYSTVARLAFVMEIMKSNTSLKYQIDVCVTYYMFCYMLSGIYNLFFQKVSSC